MSDNNTPESVEPLTEHDKELNSTLLNAAATDVQTNIEKAATSEQASRDTSTETAETNSSNTSSANASSKDEPAVQADSNQEKEENALTDKQPILNDQNAINDSEDGSDAQTAPPKEVSHDLNTVRYISCSLYLHFKWHSLQNVSASTPVAEHVLSANKDLETEKTPESVVEDNMAIEKNQDATTNVENEDMTSHVEASAPSPQNRDSQIDDANTHVEKHVEEHVHQPELEVTGDEQKEVAETQTSDKVDVESTSLTTSANPEVIISRISSPVYIHIVLYRAQLRFLSRLLEKRRRKRLKTSPPARLSR